MKSLEEANWPDEHAGVRDQLIRLIRARRVKYGAPPERPARIGYLQVVNPESGLPLTRTSMWHVIDQALDSGTPLKAVTMRRPPGERGWTFRFRLASAEPLVYVKSRSSGHMSSCAASTTRSVTAMPRFASPPTVLRELDGPDTCDMCGTPGLKTELVRDPFIYGAGDDGVELVVDIPVRTCSSCGPYTDDEAEDIRHDEVCRHLGVLTPTEIRDLRTKYDLSRAELARISGLGESSIARWETREIIQNVANDRYLRLLRDPAIFLRAKSLASPEPVHAEPGELPPDLVARLRDSGARFTLQPVAA